MAQADFQDQHLLMAVTFVSSVCVRALELFLRDRQVILCHSFDKIFSNLSASS